MTNVPASLSKGMQPKVKDELMKIWLVKSRYADNKALNILSARFSAYSVSD